MDVVSLILLALPHLFCPSDAFGRVNETRDGRINPGVNDVIDGADVLGPDPMKDGTLSLVLADRTNHFRVLRGTRFSEMIHFAKMH